MNSSFKLAIVVWFVQLCHTEECEKLRAAVSSKTGLLADYESNTWSKLNDKLNGQHVYRTRFRKKVLHDISLHFQHFLGYKKDRFYNDPTTKTVVNLGSGYAIFSIFDSFLYLSNSTNLKTPLYQYFNGSFDLDKNITFRCQFSGNKEVVKRTQIGVKYELKDKLIFLLWSTLLIIMTASV